MTPDKLESYQFHILSPCADLERILDHKINNVLQTHDRYFREKLDVSCDICLTENNHITSPQSSSQRTLFASLHYDDCSLEDPQ